MLERRMQVSLDERRYEKVAHEAARRGVSLAAVIRDAIDMLPDENSRRRAAVEAILSAEPCEVPDDPAELVRELHALRDSPVR